MKRTIGLGLAAATLCSLLATGDAQAKQYPINSIAYRKTMTALIQSVRTQCSARCPHEAVAPMNAALAKMESRITEVCADGWVTAAEDDYVLAVMPDMPKQKPPEK